MNLTCLASLCLEPLDLWPNPPSQLGLLLLLPSSRGLPPGCMMSRHLQYNNNNNKQLPPDRQSTSGTQDNPPLLRLTSQVMMVDGRWNQEIFIFRRGSDVMHGPIDLADSTLRWPLSFSATRSRVSGDHQVNWRTPRSRVTHAGNRLRSPVFMGHLEPCPCITKLHGWLECRQVLIEKKRST